MDVLYSRPAIVYHTFNYRLIVDVETNFKQTRQGGSEMAFVIEKIPESEKVKFPFINTKLSSRWAIDKETGTQFIDRTKKISAMLYKLIKTRMENFT